MMAEIVVWTSIGLICYTYVVYVLILYVIVKMKGGRGVRSESRPLPSVSVVLSAYNEERTLPGKIENLKRIDYPEDKIEFVVGSDGSTDKTQVILESVKASQFRIVIHHQRRGKAAVLNDLVLKAAGDIIVFTDANTVFENDTIVRLVKAFEDPQVGAVCGNLVLRADAGTAGGVGESAYWRYENVIKQLESAYKTVFGGTGAVYAIRKSLYTILPTSKPVTDDLVIPLKILEQGYFTKYEAQALAYEESENSVLGEFRRKVRISAQNFNSVGEFRSLLNPGRGFVAFALWSHKVIRWMVPFFLMAIVAATLVLSSSWEAYRILLLLETAFVGLAVVGLILDIFRIKIGILGIPYYVLATNAAILVGFARFLLKQEQPMWNVVRK